MLRSIQTFEQHLIEDDPVRPHIPYQDRVAPGRSVVVLEQSGTPAAVLCLALCSQVPTTEQELYDYADTSGDVLVAYTVWSYVRGAGREIINLAREAARDEHCARLVTLSPLTEMAERFHIRNGARFVAKYEHCQNFEYDI